MWIKSKAEKVPHYNLGEGVLSLVKTGEQSPELNPKPLKHLLFSCAAVVAILGATSHCPRAPILCSAVLGCLVYIYTKIHKGGHVPVTTLATSVIYTETKKVLLCWNLADLDFMSARNHSPKPEPKCSHLSVLSCFPTEGCILCLWGLGTISGTSLNQISPFPSGTFRCTGLARCPDLGWVRED